MFQKVMGRQPASDEEYVEWSQARQCRALEIVLLSLKSKFPACGGAIVWDGHDDFPCPSNCSVIDFHGGLKPAAEVISRIFHTEPEQLSRIFSFPKNQIRKSPITKEKSK
ncbi:hypothetical protein SDC9_124289 [bioreactor metagenome]|uniref:Uncharacterized protein n=1 Tax=bioreactor metagenome TaxID=1076179 RepID=A0A645CK11_9ZZZZ